MLSTRRWWLALASITAVAVGVRLIGIGRNWLWYDELLSANFAYGSLLSVLIETLRFDVHPPLYYLQLHLWMLGGTSDQWLMLNSVMWSAAGVASAGWVGRRIHGDLAGLLAALLMAVCAGQAHYAQQVRMYSMVSTLIIWAYYWNYRAAKSDSRALRGEWRWALLFEGAVVYSHGAGFLMLSGVVLSSLALAWETNRRAGAGRWLATHLVVFALALPVVIFARAKTEALGHLGLPTGMDVLRAWNHLVTGRSRLEAEAAAGAILLAAVCVFFAWRQREARGLILFGVVTPIAVFAGLSYLVRPLWHEKNLLAVTPFVCLGLACGISYESRLGRGGRLLAVSAVIAVTAAGCLAQQFQRTKGDSFRAGANAAKSMAAPGDVVLFRGHEWDYLCFMWYFGGPDWGEPRTIQTFARPQGWERSPMLARLLPLFLLPDPGFVMAGGVKVVGEFQDPRPLNGAHRIIRVVSAPRWSSIRSLALPPVEGRTRGWSQVIGAVTLEIWD